MKPIKITIEFADGSTWFTTNPSELRDIGLNLPKQVRWMQGARAEMLRNRYFLMLTELAKAANTGDTKADLHEQMKPLIFRKFVDFTHYYTNGVPEYSTRNLTREGWIATIEQLKVVANDVFNYTFKDNG
jgi:hypothetical protein